MTQEVSTIEQTRSYLLHIISQLDGYTLDLICEYLDINDDEILEYFEPKL